MAVGRRAAHLSVVLDRKKGERSQIRRYFTKSANRQPIPELVQGVHFEIAAMTFRYPEDLI